MKIRAFITHKLIESYSDCQDRFSINEQLCRVAVSDGVSQSIFSDYWAEKLSDYYVTYGHCSDEDRIALCDNWLEYVENFISEEEKKGKKTYRLRNFLQQKRGAGATLCGVTFENESKWHGHVIGDSCIVEVDKNSGSCINIYSSQNKEFDNLPDYYDSFAEISGRGQIVEKEGEICNTVTLLLVSDPFSDYFQKEPEESKKLIKELLQCNNHERYCTIVDDWRKRGLHNDDSTIVIVEYNGKHDFEIMYLDEINSLIRNENKGNSSSKEILIPNTPSNLCKDDVVEVSAALNDENFSSKNNITPKTRGKWQSIIEQEVDDFIKKHYPLGHNKTKTNIKKLLCKNKQDTKRLVTEHREVLIELCMNIVNKINQ